MKSFLLMLIAILIISIVSIPAIILNMIRKVYRRESISKYLLTIAIGFDQAGGSILYGQEDWTVSSWTYYLEQCGNKHAQYFRVIIDLIFGKNHCKESYFAEAERLKFNAEWM
ncbi:hypothetical protein [Sulfuricurvum sp.]|uniref:hypothetical protein n=1 Tax=Sulfuricurvum sp. TaxID=2025608 RepID=UPI003BAFCDB8